MYRLAYKIRLKGEPKTRGGLMLVPVGYGKKPSVQRQNPAIDNLPQLRLSKLDSDNGPGAAEARAFARKWNERLGIARLLSRLTELRIRTESRLQSTEDSLQRMSPGIFSSREILGPMPLEVWGGKRGGVKGHGDLVIRRDAVVARYPQLSNEEICKKFDGQDYPIPVPYSWTEKGIKTYHQAYMTPSHRARVKKMISIARKRLRLRLP